jgi:hypothetical protein
MVYCTGYTATQASGCRFEAKCKESQDIAYSQDCIATTPTTTATTTSTVTTTEEAPTDWCQNNGMGADKFDCCYDNGEDAVSDDCAAGVVRPADRCIDMKFVCDAYDDCPRATKVAGQSPDEEIGCALTTTKSPTTTTTATRKLWNVAFPEI